MYGPSTAAILPLANQRVFERDQALRKSKETEPWLGFVQLRKRKARHHFFFCPFWVTEVLADSFKDALQRVEDRRCNSGSNGAPASTASSQK